MAILGPTGICYSQIRTGPSSSIPNTTGTPQNTIGVKPRQSYYYIYYGENGHPEGYINKETKRLSSQEPLVTNNNNPLVVRNLITSPYIETYIGSTSLANFSPCGIGTGEYLFVGDRLLFTSTIASGFFLKNPNNYTKITSDSAATTLNKWYYNTQNKKLLYKTEVPDGNGTQVVSFPPIGAIMKVHCSRDITYPTDNFHLVFRVSHNGTTEDVVGFNVINGEGTFEFECDEDSRITIFNFRPSGWPTAAGTAMPSNYMGNISGGTFESFYGNDLNPSVTAGYQTSPITSETGIHMQNS